MDTRVEKLAKLLVHYSNKIKPGDRVNIGGDIAAMPLLQAIHRECTQAGAFFNDSINIWSPKDFDVYFYKHADECQLTHFPKEWKFPYLMSTDATFSIFADENPVAATHIDPEKMKIAARALGEYDALWHERTSQGLLRWVIACFPCNGYAIMAGMSLSEYEDFVYGACFVDKEDPIAEWQKVAAFNQRLVDYLSDKKQITFKGSHIGEITMSVEGRTWIPCNGDDNMPDGEVFTAPVEDSVEGVVRFSFPTVYEGHEVDGIMLAFEKGRVVEAKAKKGEKFLHEMLDIDEGSKILGEVGIGTNFGIQRHTKEILFDEKIGGTFHLALGSGYLKSGSLNHSSLHWDMIADLRQDGEILVDDTILFRNGVFIQL